MPWKECSVMDERLRFVSRLLDGKAMSEVCREFGVSRKTGYKIFGRYKEHGLEALSDRSRRPVRYANQLPAPIEAMVVAFKQEKPHWGARKIRELLVRRLAGDVRVPAKSTIHAVLHRHGLVQVPGRPRRRAGRRAQPVAHAGDGDDLERRLGPLGGDAPKLADAAADRVLAHRQPAPAAADQFVLRHHLGRTMGQGRQHLHDTALERVAFAVGLNLAQRGPHRETADGEVGLARQVDPGQDGAIEIIHRNSTPRPSPACRFSGRLYHIHQYRREIGKGVLDRRRGRGGEERP
jgi:transposase